MDDNQKTLKSYQDHIQDYVAGTPQAAEGPIKEWIDRAVSYLPKDGNILELGSAFGRDADYLESIGCKVLRTDAVQGFVDLLRKQGHSARLLNALTDDFGGPYDMVFANAVLLHFNPEESQRVLNKAHKSLRPEGILAFSVKEGEGEEWSDQKLDAPRYFCYWKEEDLRSLIQEAGFEIIELGHTTTRHAEWLHVIAKIKQMI